MRKCITIIAIMLLSSVSIAASGGPDAYGYTWEDSNEPTGPIYNWVDITTTGTQVTGLADDNSVAFINMGMDFHYYWIDYSQIKIGSNGWLSFENTNNIAHCFPVIPSAGGAGDNFLAPFMSDLIFGGVGNTAEVYYEFDAPNDRFIVSYIDVPWWQAAAPGFTQGTNSFQVILNNSDSSIVFQYQSMDASSFNDMGGCSQDAVIGMEGPGGNMGLQCWTETVPAANYAIRFTYPNPVLLQVPDILAESVLNTESAAEFHNLIDPIPIDVIISSVGNTDVTTDISVTVDVVNQNAVNLFTQSFTITGGLAIGQDSLLSIIYMPTEVGELNVNMSVSNNQDINPTNDMVIAELQIRDLSVSPNTYVYVDTAQNSSGSIIWNTGAGDGVGIYIEPNEYPFVIESVAGYASGLTDNFILELYEDNGANGLPGTQISSDTIASANVVIGDWNTITFSTPDTIYSGGFYVVWKQVTTTTISLGTYSNGPISHRSFEYLGVWEEYRDNDISEFMLLANGRVLCYNYSASVDSVTNVDCFGGSTGAIETTVIGGNPTYDYLWSNGDTTANITGLVAGQYILTTTDMDGCEVADTVTITENTAIQSSATVVAESAGNDGEIDLTVSGGTAPYSYSWDNGAGTVEDPTGLAGGSYTVTILDSLGCSMDTTIVVGSTLGLSDLSSVDWGVYPNPSEGTFTVVAEMDKSSQIRIFDALGRMIFASDFKEEIEVKGILPGVYHIQIQTESGVFTKELIVR